MALASLGVYTASTSAARSAGVHYVVAARDIPLGHRLTAADLTTAAMELPATGPGRRAFLDPRRLVGAVAVAPVGRGELVQASAVARRGPAGRHLSFAVDPARAVGGALRAGDRIDVLATYGTGSDAWTDVVVRDAPVVHVDVGRGGLGEQGRLVLTVSVADEPAALSLGHAASAGVITIVRATGEPTTARLTTGYRPEPAPAAAP